MKVWVARGVLVAALIILGIWGWRTFFPSPELIIRKRLIELAALACISPNEAMLTKLSKSQKLASYFATDAEIEIDLPGKFPQSLTGRNDIMRGAASARNFVSSLKVEFLDITVKMASDGHSGIAHFTVKADVPGEATPQVEELQADFKEIEHAWLIQRVTNVRTLR
jgi:hypothetical protein